MATPEPAKKPIKHKQKGLWKHEGRASGWVKAGQTVQVKAMMKRLGL